MTENLDLRVTSGSPSGTELAATHAVLGAAVQQLSDETHRRKQTGRSAWDLSTRVLRTPLQPQSGWRSFSG
ncbi:acyl-CoA carboxylase subunit epsilon [Diaminobutyricimonas sp. TR449]|uniref:acyl-CoA carboxylase subunit epsilon n=1 Tax=Diaminobutyricimonas sp. TR449 TaxID=2708076 RepID=UPI001421B224|nr:acyl-CoA carboxylase subunit epsilon [Diaminobutyricimonas sp. TR449]